MPTILDRPSHLRLTTMDDPEWVCVGRGGDSPTIKPDQARSGAWERLSHPSLDGGAVSLRLAGTGAPLESESSAVVHVANMRRHEPYSNSGPVIGSLTSFRTGLQGKVVLRATGIVDRSLFGPWSLLVVCLRRLYSL